MYDLLTFILINDHWQAKYLIFRLHFTISSVKCWRMLHKMQLILHQPRSPAVTLCKICTKKCTLYVYSTSIPHPPIYLFSLQDGYEIGMGIKKFELLKRNNYFGCFEYEIQTAWHLFLECSLFQDWRKKWNINTNMIIYSSNKYLVGGQHFFLSNYYNHMSTSIC